MSFQRQSTSMDLKRTGGNTSVVGVGNLPPLPKPPPITPMTLPPVGATPGMDFAAIGAAVAANAQAAKSAFSSPQQQRPITTYTMPTYGGMPAQQPMATAQVGAPPAGSAADDSKDLGHVKHIKTVVDPEIQLLHSQVLRYHSAYYPSPGCAFRTVFYDIAEDDERAENASSSSGTSTGGRKQPNEVVGFRQLLQRSKFQRLRVEEIDTLLDELAENVREAKRIHTADVHAAAKARINHSELEVRLLKCMRRLEVVKSQGSVLAPSEEHLRRKFTELDGDITAPGQVRDRLQELVERVKRHVAARQTEGVVVSEEVRELDQPNREEVQHILVERQQGLIALREQVMQDRRELTVLLTTLRQQLALRRES